jgi:hypothetical protein
MIMVYLKTRNCEKATTTKHKNKIKADIKLDHSALCCCQLLLCVKEETKRSIDVYYARHQPYSI